MSVSRQFETDYRILYTMSVTRNAENPLTHRRVPWRDTGGRLPPRLLGRIASLSLAVLLVAGLLGPANHHHEDGKPSSTCVVCHVAPDLATGAAKITVEVRPLRITPVSDPVVPGEPSAFDLQGPAHRPRAPPVTVLS